MKKKYQNFAFFSPREMIIEAIFFFFFFFFRGDRLKLIFLKDGKDLIRVEKSKIYGLLKVPKEILSRENGVFCYFVVPNYDFTP